MKPYLLKVPEGMLERWKETAAERGTSCSQMIREAVNKDIDAGASDARPFSDSCGMITGHVRGNICSWCGGSR
jgi:hypothetical protein